MPVKINFLDEDHLVRRYIQGESGWSIIRMSWIPDTKALNRLLLSYGVEVRSRSAASAIRFARPDQQELRRTSLIAAHNATRGLKIPRERAIRSAEARARALQVTGGVIGKFEDELCEMLRDLGVEPVRQLAVSTYNIDLAVFPVAVEVHVSGGTPLRNAHNRKRVEYLADRGWSTVYVWISKAHPLLRSCAEKLVALFQLAESDPATLRQHRVIWGSGELPVVRRRDTYHPPLE